MNDNINLNKVHVFKTLSYSRINAWINKHHVKVLQLLKVEDNKIMILYQELGDKPIKENLITRDKICWAYNREDKRIKALYKENQIDLNERNLQLKLNKINYWNRLITEVSDEIGENKVVYYMNKIKALKEEKDK